MGKVVHSWARFDGGNSDVLKRIIKACGESSEWIGTLIPSVRFDAIEVIEESDKGFSLVMISDVNPFDAITSLPLSEDVTMTMGWEYGIGVKNRIQGIVQVELSQDEIATIDDGSDQYDIIIHNMLNSKLNEVW
jgi:hypothetical protein